MFIGEGVEDGYLLLCIDGIWFVFCSGGDFMGMMSKFKYCLDFL